MAENSKIEWTDHTFNPWIGCTKVSPACKNCYAERDFDLRYGKAKWGDSGTRVVTGAANWKKPVQWNREAGRTGTRPRVFCASLADVFEDWQAPMDTFETMQEVRKRLFRLIDETPNLDWLLLTKRPENVCRMWTLPPCPAEEEGKLKAWFRPNVWLGTSVENQEYADKRIPELMKCRDLASVLFLSCEPLTGPVDVKFYESDVTPTDANPVPERQWLIDWVITGGESGANARPADPNWFRSLRDQCDASGVPFHFKQWGEFDEHQVRVGKKNAGRLLDGVTHDGLPVVQTV